MTIERCTERTRDPLIVIKEKGKKAGFRNPEREEHRKIRIDGCVITKGERSDYLLANDRVGHLLIELKGRGVEKAISQIFTTANYWRQTFLGTSKMSGLIVSSRMPRIDTIAQRAKAEFKRQHGGKLKFVSHNQMHDLASFF